jgi:hypothetical protein
MATIDTDTACSVNEAAALLGMTKWGVFAMLRDGRWLRAEKANGAWFIDRASVDEVLAARRSYEDPNGPLADLHRQQTVYQGEDKQD